MCLQARFAVPGAAVDGEVCSLSRSVAAGELCAARVPGASRDCCAPTPSEEREKEKEKEREKEKENEKERERKRKRERERDREKKRERERVCV